MMDRDDERGASAEENIRPSWSDSARPVLRLVLQPLQTFLRTEEAGGILLLAAAVAALLWANSPWRASYDAVWHAQLTIGLGPWFLAEDLQHWVNDALMALFFLVVGLEIKRELTTGELRQPRAAALPAIAAVGGMAVPALLYLAISRSGEPARGWGIPMATDIAFALGVLAFVGRIRERTSAGLAAARARGRSGGRPLVITAHKLQVAREMHGSGQYTVAAIATTLGVSRASIYWHPTNPDR